MRPVGRRHFLIAAGAVLAAPRMARTQSQKRLPVLGVLNPFLKPAPEALASNPFYKRLRELRWIEGESLRVERAFAENNFDRLPRLAAMLVERKVDVIWAWGSAAAVAAARVTKSIPVVFWWTVFPVELGLVNSLARPGRNVTGTAWSATGLVENYLKQAQLLREIAPAARRLARIRVLDWLTTVGGDAWDGSAYHASIDAGMRKLGFEVRQFGVRNDGDFDEAFNAIVQWGADSLFVHGGDLIASAGSRIVEFARSNRLPDAHYFPHLVHRGGLISYSLNPLPSLLRTAEYVDQILRGARPADLPVDLPQHYEITVNLKTAKALDLKVPQPILFQATRVIK